MSFELARPEWLALWVAIPLWWYWLSPRMSWGLLVARGQEATSISLRRWLGWLAENTPRAFRALAVTLLIIALAEPRLVSTYEEPVTEGVGIAFAIDLSTSMWAEDMAERTTRLEAAKETVLRFLENRTDDVGLVSFAGEALTRMPLTHDQYVARAAVDALEVGLLIDGTDISSAIASGAALLRDAPHRSKVLILVTDGAHNKTGLIPTRAARAAAAFDVKIFAIAIGTDQSFGSGPTNMETVLTQTALITGGRYFKATDMAALDEIYEEIDQLAVPSEELVERTESTPLSHWLLIASLPFLLMGSALRASRWGVLP